MHKNFMSTVIHCFFLSVLIFTSSIHILYSQALRDLSKEILIYVQPSGITFPSSERGQLAPNSISVHSSKLVQAFTKFKVGAVSKAFPDFLDADTLRIAEDGRKISVPQLSRIFRLQIQDQGDIDSAIAVLSKMPDVLFAEKNMKAQLQYDPTYNNQWYLNNTGQSGGTAGADIRAEEAWSIFTGSSSVKIGIIDGGVEISHEDLNGKASGDVDDINDGLYHGTHVAGIAAAIADNNKGGRGVDWNAQILSKRIFSASSVDQYNPRGYVGDANAAQKIIDAVNTGANVINNSWSGTTCSTTLRFAFTYAYKMNRISVAGMGNDYNSGNPTQYPAAFGQGIIAVGATTDQDSRSNYSQTGNHIDVVAPGGINLSNFNQHDIWSTWGGSTYSYYTGTSMATPVVSGIASLLKGYNSNLSNDDIEHIIQLSADDVNSTQYPGWDQYLGYGRVNARNALNKLRSPNVLTQATTTGGTDQGASNSFAMVIYGAQAYGLSDGAYLVKRHEVRKTVNFYPMQNHAVWGRGVFTNSWADNGQVNFSMGWCDAVPGTLSNAGVTLRSYVYEVWNMQGQSLGWKPVQPSNVTFAYTVLGVPIHIALGGLVGPTYLQSKQTGTWHPAITSGSGSYTYQWYTSNNGGSTWTTLGTSYTQSRTMINKDIIMRCDVHDNGTGENASAQLTVHYGIENKKISIDNGQIAILAKEIPTSFSVGSYPNPFNPTTTINYQLPFDGIVKLGVFDVLGREVGILVNETKLAGLYAATFNASRLPSGVYFARISVTSNEGKPFVQTIKMLLTK